jgi:hypothetical protein
MFNSYAFAELEKNFSTKRVVPAKPNPTPDRIAAIPGFRRNDGKV